MPRELSTAWWNVLRRKMTATRAKQDDSARCPDCDGTMHLMDGRYKCDLWGCQGTLGARLDGSPRQPRNVPPELLEARRRAARAVRQLISAIKDPDLGSATSFWLDAYINVAPDIEKVIWLAELTNDYDWPMQRTKPGLHLRKRSIEECRRVEAAANRWRREKYPCCWDRLGEIDETP